MSVINTRLEVHAVYYGEHAPVNVEFRWQDYWCAMKLKEDLPPAQLAYCLEELARRIRDDIKRGVAR